MWRGWLTGLRGHGINAGTLILKLLLKPLNLPLQTQYVLLLGGQRIIQRAHCVLNKRDLRLDRCNVTHRPTSQTSYLWVLV
jgi:hypothetical protein